MVAVRSTVAALAAGFLLNGVNAAQSCDSVQAGYQCNDAISHSWGQYSPYFTLASQSPYPDALNSACTVNFVQLLNRHGARFPTASKTAKYNATILALKKSVNATAYTGKYAFLKTFNYTLGADILTAFGQQELVNSGIKFYERYESLAKNNVPFVRADDEARVVQSALNWTQGFHETREADQSANHADGYPYPVVAISDAAGYNNTLSADTCNNYDNGYESNTGSDAQATFAATFVPNITARLNADLPGANLTTTTTIYLMDLCPFETVASPGGNTLSPFCSLFTQQEWDKYNYYESLGKWYSDGNGNALGPTQGAGWVNELIARLTNKPVEFGASVNSTLDSSSATFPLGKALYADFSHDDEMTSIFTALGLYNNTGILSNTTVEEAQALSGYSAAWTVPFAGRMYFEKMTCPGYREDLVRAIVNDRVVSLVGCGADRQGRCTLSSFVASQSFSQGLGLWNQLC